jgi:hypothetical protein
MSYFCSSGCLELEATWVILSIFDNKWLIVTIDEPVAQDIWCRLLYESTNFSISNMLAQK